MLHRNRSRAVSETWNSGHLEVVDAFIHSTHVGLFEKYIETLARRETLSYGWLKIYQESTMFRCKSFTKNIGWVSP